MRAAWPQGWFAYARMGYEPDFWHGTLVEDKGDASGFSYRRNRYYDPQAGRFTQEDPIGLAGGLNVYGFAAGDPVSYSDPSGLCVDGLTTLACLYAAFEIASTAYDLADLALTSVRYARGRATRSELGATSAGVIAGIYAPGGGYGQAARAIVREGASDLGLWKQMASSELMEEARRGIGTVVAGAGHGRRTINDVNRLVAQYGGNASDWAKMSTRGRTAEDGTSLAIHWYENVRTGQRVEFKTKFREQ